MTWGMLYSIRLTLIFLDHLQPIEPAANHTDDQWEQNILRLRCHGSETQGRILHGTIGTTSAAGRLHPRVRKKLLWHHRPFQLDRLLRALCVCGWSTGTHTYPRGLCAGVGYQLCQLALCLQPDRPSGRQPGTTTQRPAEQCYFQGLYRSIHHRVLPPGDGNTPFGYQQFRHKSVSLRRQRAGADAWS